MPPSFLNASNRLLWLLLGLGGTLAACEKRDTTSDPTIGVSTISGEATGEAPPPTLTTAFAAPPGAPSIRFVPPSTKVEQLIGEEDHERRVSTRSRTASRYGINGTDLGYSFEHQGRAYFLFGDTNGRLGHALDTIATTTATDAEAGVQLDFLTVGDDYLTIQPPGISMGAFEVPVAGISLGGQMYVIVRTNRSRGACEPSAMMCEGSTERSVLTRFTPPATFTPLRTISQLPGGHFITVSVHLEPQRRPEGMPAGGPYVLVWGTGIIRRSDLYLSLVPAASFESGEGTQYFAGTGPGGAPTWSPREADARPALQHGTLGDVSVTWNETLGLWLMTYDQRAPDGKGPGGAAFAYARTPWGPWSTPQVLLLPRDIIGKFGHRADSDDGLEGPVCGPENQKHPRHAGAGLYAPYIVERFTKVQGSELDLYYLASIWNPYVAVLMKSRFQIQ